MTPEHRTVPQPFRRATRAVAATGLAAVLASASAGCGALSSAHTLVDRASLLGSMATKISHAQKATFQATYAVGGSGRTAMVTVVQQPPSSSAYLTASSRILSTGGHTYLCETGSRTPRCQQTGAGDGTVDPSGALGVTGFVSGELALGVMSAAMLVPKARVTSSSQTIAGQPTSCVTVSGLKQALAGVFPSSAAGTADTGLSDFTACITEGGVLARFSGGLTDGRHGDVLLTRYSATVDRALLELPTGAKITG